MKVSHLATFALGCMPACSGLSNAKVASEVNALMAALESNKATFDRYRGDFLSTLSATRALYHIHSAMLKTKNALSDMPAVAPEELDEWDELMREDLSPRVVGMVDSVSSSAPFVEQTGYMTAAFAFVQVFGQEKDKLKEVVLGKMPQDNATAVHERFADVDLAFERLKAAYA
ncbi:hypothetical protein BJX61DRAFT_540630 [Aspergillus egyptiacus]|nr:hypothetical protein BJX61DRAFT_540630 [Aspergillus egyptiacus]